MAYKRNCKEGNLPTKLDEAVFAALIRIGPLKPIKGHYALNHDCEMAARAPRMYCHATPSLQLSPV